MGIHNRHRGTIGVKHYKSTKGHGSPIGSKSPGGKSTYPCDKKPNSNKSDDNESGTDTGWGATVIEHTTYYKDSDGQLWMTEAPKGSFWNIMGGLAFPKIKDGIISIPNGMEWNYSGEDE